MTKIKFEEFIKSDNFINYEFDKSELIYVNVDISFPTASVQKERKNTILTFAIAGALAGLAGAFFYLSGFENWQTSASSVPAMGFNGIAATFLGGLNPIGTILASFFIQHITAGGAYFDKTMYCSQISDLISSLIIYLCGFVLFIKTGINKRIDKAEEKAAKKALETGKGGKTE